MPNYIDSFIHHDLIATATVNAYSLNDPTSTIIKTFNVGDDMGTIETWLQDSQGNIWWAIYPGGYYNLNIPPYYIYNDASKMAVPDVSQPLTGINVNKPLPEVVIIPTIGEEIASGLSNITSSIGNYIPWIIGGVLVIAFLPSIINSINKRK